jgi:hypothetical protein
MFMLGTFLGPCLVEGCARRQLGAYARPSDRSQSAHRRTRNRPNKADACCH